MHMHTGNVEEGKRGRGNGVGGGRCRYFRKMVKGKS
jgi:hypothetical protein